MTVATLLNKVVYNGNGSTTVFAFSYPFIAPSDLVVQSVSSSGVITTKVLTTDYTISGSAPYPSGANVTMLVAPATGTKLVISRIRPFTQALDLVANDPLPADPLEQDLDHVVMLCQQLYEQVGRTLKLGIASLYSNLTIADPLANNLIGWNSTATGLENKGVSSASINITTFFAAGNQSPTVVPVAAGTDALSIGNKAITAGARAIAVGNAYASGADSLCMQNADNTTTYGAKGDNSSCIGGGFNLIANTSPYSAIVGGTSNTINDSLGQNTIIGGSNNLIDGAIFRAAILGGDFNHVSGARSVIIGGVFGIVSANQSASLAGTNNTVGGVNAAIIAGSGNTVNGAQGVVIGGQSNESDGDYSAIVGGGSGFISSQYSAIVGGNGGFISTNYSAVIAGNGGSVSGAYGAVIAGNSNTILSGNRNVIIGGDTSTVGTGDNLGAILGTGHFITGSRSVAIGGNTNTISGADSVAIGGANNTITGQFAAAFGSYANATMQSQVTYASGRFTALGDAQSSVLISRNITTDATQTELFLDGATATKRLVLPNDTTWCFDILISARRTDADNESGAYRIVGCIDRNATAASTALVGSVTVTTIAEDNAAWDVTATADTTNGALLIKVTGQAAKNVRWVARTTLVETTG